MNDITITCPKCGAEVPLSEAVSHRIREQLAGDFDQKRRENEGALAAREQKLRESQSALEQQQGIVGQNALPDTAPLQLPSPEEKQPTPLGAESTSI